MNKQELDTLLGLSVDEAEKIVVRNKLKPESSHERSFAPAITLPENVVSLGYNDNKIVTSAKTQETIDAIYQRN